VSAPLQEYLWHKGLLLLEPFNERFRTGLLSMNEGVFDGNAPYASGQNCASAISTAELLRIYTMLAQMHVMHTESMLAPQR
jgi:hypothetical protein